MSTSLPAQRTRDGPRVRRAGLYDRHRGKQCVPGQMINWTNTAATRRRRFSARFVSCLPIALPLPGYAMPDHDPGCALSNCTLRSATPMMNACARRRPSKRSLMRPGSPLRETGSRRNLAIAVGGVLAGASGALLAVPTTRHSHRHVRHARPHASGATESLIAGSGRLVGRRTSRSVRSAS